MNASHQPELWQNLVRAALLGADRQAPETPASDGSLGVLIAGLDPSDRERALLGAAAAVTAYDRAGRQPEKASAPLPEPCTAEDLPPCSPRAAQQLAMMLAGQYQTLLVEWLDVASDAGRRVPTQHLPGILDLGRRQTLLRSVMLPVLGKRGQWLAQLNGEWRWAVGGNDSDEWLTASRESRQALLATLRRTDAAKARELLAATWAQEAVETRALFLKTMGIRLSEEDEPSLETALDHRGKELRAIAADLLARLPGSALSRRMIERVEPLLSFTPATKARLLGVKPGEKARLNVTLPEECTPEMIRDGIDPKPPTGTGEKVWWLIQMLAGVPPGYWEQKWNVTPAEIIGAAQGTEWEISLLDGWMIAAERHPQSGWAEPLLSAWADLLARKKMKRTTTMLEPAAVSLARSLPPHILERLLGRSLECGACPLCKDEPLFSVLLESALSFNVGAGRVALTIFRDHVGHSKTPDHGLQPKLQQMGYTLPPALAPEASHGWPTEGKCSAAWEKTIDEFVTTMQFRGEIIEAFNEST